MCSYLSYYDRRKFETSLLFRRLIVTFMVASFVAGDCSLIEAVITRTTPRGVRDMRHEDVGTKRMGTSVEEVRRLLLCETTNRWAHFSYSVTPLKGHRRDGESHTIKEGHLGR